MTASMPSDVAAARVVLIGFMGAGKSTIAQRWATAGGPVLWFDSDEAALCRLGCATVTEAFEQHGETGFRTAERDVILERAQLMRRGVEVWSLGGGAIADPDVQRAVLDSTIVWLDAPVDVLWDRCQGTDRPLAADRAAFERLYSERSSLYESLATTRVETTGELAQIGLGRVLAEQLPRGWFGSGLAVGRHLLERVHELCALQGGRSVVFVADQAVETCARSLLDLFAAAGQPVIDECLLPMGEWNKQMDTVEQLLRRWSAARLDRSGVVVALGGGTLLDTAGFAASIYQRGVDWVSIPTTVTAQVDAGVGGKTGVNLGAIKNAVGAVHLPRATVIDPDALRGLDLSYVCEGFVEAAKTALLAGGPLLDTARRCAEQLADGVAHGKVPDLASQEWLELVSGCASFKDSVVADDPFDTDGIRAQLNLGHTLGHAIEAATSNAVSHGAAVAVGIHAALHLSARELDADPDLASDWAAMFASLRIPVTSPLEWEQIEPWLAHDKKRGVEGLGWVLLQRPGTPVTEVRLETASVREVWEQHIHRAGEPVARASSADARPKVLVLFGVNLDQLGRRDAQHYGSDDLATLVRRIEAWAADSGLVAECRQTNSLERFVGAIHEADQQYAALLLNPGAWTHHERALHDAVEPLTIPTVEVHLSDIDSREPWRGESVIEPVVSHRVSGAGAEGYRTALEWVRDAVLTRG